MNTEQAKDILLLHRPGVAPFMEMTEALEEAAANPELARWFENHRAGQEKIRAGFRAVHTPEGLREQIVSERPKSGLEREISPRLILALVVFAAVVTLSGGLASRWWRHREAISFAAYSNAMVATALTDYGMTASESLPDIRAKLAGQHAPADYELPASLVKLKTTGFAVLSWDGQPVSMVCFRKSESLPGGRTSDTWLVVLGNRSLPGAPHKRKPHVALVHDQPTASWVASGKTYLLVSAGDVASLKSMLGLPHD